MFLSSRWKLFRKWLACWRWWSIFVINACVCNHIILCISTSEQLHRFPELLWSFLMVVVIALLPGKNISDLLPSISWKKRWKRSHVLYNRHDQNTNPVLGPVYIGLVCWFRPKVDSQQAGPLTTHPGLCMRALCPPTSRSGGADLQIPAPRDYKCYKIELTH
jgi:hypothetical protein